MHGSTGRAWHRRRQGGSGGDGGRGSAGAFPMEPPTLKMYPHALDKRAR